LQRGRHRRLFSLGLSASGAMDTPEGRYVGIRFALGV
jgi:hypothetical protein